MEYKDIQVDVQDPIATVTLNRPQNLNAYTNLIGDELTHAYESLGEPMMSDHYTRCWARVLRWRRYRRGVPEKH